MAKRMFHHSSYLLVGHKKLDPDCFCSLLAMGELLNKSQKKICILAEKNTLPFFDLESARFVSDKKPSFSSFDAVVCLDNSGSQIAEEFKFDQSIVENFYIIDHHKTTTSGINPANSIVDQTATSTCEIIYSISKELSIEIAKNCAKNIALGTLSDCGFFQNDNTSENTIRLLAEISNKFKVNLGELILLLRQIDVESLKSIGVALGNLRLSESLNVATSYIDDSPKSLSLISNLLMSLKDRATTILSSRNGKNIKLSTRTKSDTADLSLFCQMLYPTGGGHKKASGVEFEDYESSLTYLYSTNTSSSTNA